MLKLLELSIQSITVKEELNNYDIQICKYLKNNNEGYIALERLKRTYI